MVGRKIQSWESYHLLYLHYIALHSFSKMYPPMEFQENIPYNVRDIQTFVKMGEVSVFIFCFD